MKKNILITSVGGDIGGNIVKIIRKQNLFEYCIVGTDIKKHVFSELDLDYFYQVSRIGDPKYIVQLKNIIEKHKIDLIIPSSEYDILFLHQNTELFDSMNVQLLVNNKNIVNTFLDKFQTSNILTNLDITTPKTYNLSIYSDQLDFPVILKASSSTTSKIIKIITNEQELVEAKLNIGDKNKFIIQKYIGTENEEYTTAIYKNKNFTKVITFKRQLDGDKTGYAEIYNSKKLEDYPTKIANEFDLKGSINIQSRKSNDDFYIFEINPRISSTVYIRDHFEF